MNSRSAEKSVVLKEGKNERCEKRDAPRTELLLQMESMKAQEENKILRAEIDELKDLAQMESKKAQEEKEFLRAEVDELKDLLAEMESKKAKKEREELRAEEKNLLRQTTHENERLKVNNAQLVIENDIERGSDSPIPTSMSISQLQLNPIVETLLELRSNNQPSNLIHLERVFTEHTTLLAPLKSVCPKIKILLSHLLTNTTTVKQKKARVSAGSEATRLHDLTDAEAEVLGKSFKKFLIGNKEVETAVNAWKLDNPILEPLFAELIFEPIIIAIAKELMVASTLGLVKRVIIGAGLSIGDMITDVSVIISYLNSGKTKQAYSLIAMMGLSISLQLLIAYVQNRKKSKWAIFRELLIVLSGLKPAVDAYRVATGYEDELNTFDPLTDMVFGKSTELACESIPGERVKNLKN